VQPAAIVTQPPPKHSLCHCPTPLPSTQTTVQKEKSSRTLKNSVICSAKPGSRHSHTASSFTRGTQQALAGVDEPVRPLTASSQEPRRKDGASVVGNPFGPLNFVPPFSVDTLSSRFIPTSKYKPQRRGPRAGASPRGANPGIGYETGAVSRACLGDGPRSWSPGRTYRRRDRRASINAASG
jgi:hypothetical protein